MKNFNLKFFSIVEIPGGKNGAKSYSAVVQLKQLVAVHKMFNGDIYDVNVRGNLTGMANSNSKYERNPVHNGISKTLNKISDGFDEPISFYNKNGGALLICDPIKKVSDNEYEFSLSTPHHGFGNGQQTISISSYVDNKITISEDIYVQLQIMSGYDQFDSYNSCKSHNTGNKISFADIISNEWDYLKPGILKRGHILVTKKEEKVPSGPNVINFLKSNFYNILHSYFNETYLSSTTATESLYNSRYKVSEDGVIDAFNISNKIDEWFHNNYESYKHPTFYDTGRPGYAKIFIVIAYKKYFDRYQKATGDTIDGFLKFVMDIILKIAKTKGRKIDSQYYTQENSTTILSEINSDLSNLEKDMANERANRETARANALEEELKKLRGELITS